MTTTFDPSPSSITDVCPCGREHWITFDDSTVAIEYRCPDCSLVTRLTFADEWAGHADRGICRGECDRHGV